VRRLGLLLPLAVGGPREAPQELDEEQRLAEEHAQDDARSVREQEAEVAVVGAARRDEERDRPERVVEVLLEEVPERHVAPPHLGRARRVGELAAEREAERVLRVVLAAVLDPDAPRLVVEPRLEREALDRARARVAAVERRGDGAAHLFLHRVPLQLEVVVPGDEHHVVARRQHLGERVDDEAVALEDVRHHARRDRRRGRGPEAALARVRVGRRLGLDAQEVEDVAVQHQREARRAPRGIGAEPGAESAEVVVVEERLEAMVALRAAVDTAPEVQVRDDDQLALGGAPPSCQVPRAPKHADLPPEELTPVRVPGGAARDASHARITSGA
jgi:hypothetical protein